jgi:hypothetical protein
MAADDMRRLYEESGPWASVYIDASGDSADPRGQAASKRNSISHALEQAGAPRADIDAIVEALADPTGTPAPAARLVLASSGEVRFDRGLPGAVRVGEFAEYGAVPDLVPLVRHRPVEFEYLVVLVGHDGGDLLLCTTGTATPESREHVQGRADTLQNVRGIGWSEANYQRHAVDVWTHNEGEVAARVDELVEQRRPRFVVAAGEEAGLALFLTRLSERTRAITRGVPVDARPTDASGERLEEAISTAIDNELKTLRARAREVIRPRAVGESPVEALGIGEVVHALQQSQVELLLLVDGAGDAHANDELEGRLVYVLDGPPWVASAPEDAGEASVLGRVRAPVGLVRAAALTDAMVMVVPAEELPAHAPVAALLRWPAQAYAP